MQKINSFILAALFALPICNLSLESRIEISPHKDDVYEMAIGQTATFKADAFLKNKETQAESKANPNRLWWSFTKEFLQKVSSGEDSITLKAIRKGRAKLRAIGIINNQHTDKTITILIK